MPTDPLVTRVVIDTAGFNSRLTNILALINRLQQDSNIAGQQLDRAFRLATAAVTAFAGVLAVRELRELLDAYTQIQNRLTLVTESTRELHDVQSQLFDISASTRVAYESTAQIYARTALSARNLGRSQQELLQFTESLNQAVILSGATVREANAAMIQLSQGIASNTLRGDELRSVLEQLPFVADIIAQHFGITRGELREFAREGRVNANDILDAFRNAADGIQQAFEETTPTIGQAIEVFVSRFQQAIGATFGGPGGIAGDFATLILSIANNLDILISSLVAFGTTIAALNIPALLGVLIGFTGAITGAIIVLISLQQVVSVIAVAFVALQSGILNVATAFYTLAAAAGSGVLAIALTSIGRAIGLLSFAVGALNIGFVRLFGISGILGFGGLAVVLGGVGTAIAALLLQNFRLNQLYEQQIRHQIELNRVEREREAGVRAFVDGTEEGAQNWSLIRMETERINRELEIMQNLEEPPWFQRWIEFFNDGTTFLERFEQLTASAPSTNIAGIDISRVITPDQLVPPGVATINANNQLLAQLITELTTALGGGAPPEIDLAARQTAFEAQQRLLDAAARRGVRRFRDILRDVRALLEDTFIPAIMEAARSAADLADNFSNQLGARFPGQIAQLGLPGTDFTLGNQASAATAVTLQQLDALERLNDILQNLTNDVDDLRTRYDASRETLARLNAEYDQREAQIRQLDELDEEQRQREIRGAEAALNAARERQRQLEIDQGLTALRVGAGTGTPADDRARAERLAQEARQRQIAAELVAREEARLAELRSETITQEDFKRQELEQLQAERTAAINAATEDLTLTYTRLTNATALLHGFETQDLLLAQRQIALAADRARILARETERLREANEAANDFIDGSLRRWLEELERIARIGNTIAENLRTNIFNEVFSFIADDITDAAATNRERIKSAVFNVASTLINDFLAALDMELLRRRGPNAQNFLGQILSTAVLTAADFIGGPNVGTGFGDAPGGEFGTFQDAAATGIRSAPLRSTTGSTTIIENLYGHNPRDVKNMVDILAPAANANRISYSSPERNQLENIIDQQIQRNRGAR